MRATWFLIIAWVLASLLIWNHPNSEQIVTKLGYSTENLAKGYIWTPITSIFIHADIMHLLMNSVAFIFFGLAAEKEIGPKRMLLIFFGGALLGDVLSSLFYRFGELSIGASGGVSGVLGAAIFLAPFRFSMFPYIFPAPIVMVGIIYVLTNVIGLFADIGSNISYIAHIGGLAFGIGYGFSHVGTKKGLFIVMSGFLLLLIFFYIITLL